MKVAYEHVSYTYGLAGSGESTLPDNRRAGRTATGNYPRALSDVSCMIEPGRTVLVAGHNGSGKSTFLKLMNGIIKPDRGSVKLGDLTTSDRKTSELAKHCSLCFQNPDDQLFAATVEKELKFGIENTKSDFSILDEVASLLHLKELLRENPFSLTYAQRRLVAVGSVAAMNAPIVALDEPTSGLSRREREYLRDLIGFLSSSGKTIIVVSHDLEFSLPLTHDIILMSRGTIAYSGPKESLFLEKGVRGIFRSCGLAFPIYPRMSFALGSTDAQFSADQLVEWLIKKRAGTTLRTNGQRQLEGA